MAAGVGLEPTDYSLERELLYPMNDLLSASPSGAYRIRTCSG